MNLFKNSGLPATQAEKWPLVLDIQHFAEPGESGEGGGGNNDTDPPNDPPKPTLEEMLKSDPDLKKQYNDMFKDSFSKRLKGLDLEEARAALREKQRREEENKDKEDQESDEVKTWQTKAQRLEAKAKTLAVSAYAAENGLNAKLITRLAGDKIHSLSLDDNGDIDPDELGEIVDDIRQEFPDLFKAQDSQTPPPPPPPPSTNPGSRQRLNDPEPGKGAAGVAKVEEAFNRIKKRRS